MEVFPRKSKIHEPSLTLHVLDIAWNEKTLMIATVINVSFRIKNCKCMLGSRVEGAGGPVPSWKITKVTSGLLFWTQPAFSVVPSIGPPAKWHLNGFSLAGRCMVARFVYCVHVYRFL